MLKNQNPDPTSFGEKKRGGQGTRPQSGAVHWETKMTTYTACRLSFHATIRPNGFRDGEIIETCGHQHRTPAAAAQCDRAARLVLSSDGEQLWPEHDAAGRNTGRFIKINDQ